MFDKVRLFANPTDEEYAMAPCPGCGQGKVLDADQYFGRVSTHCADIEKDGKVLVKGCGWHQTVDWSKNATE
ncbi:hypothetical protein LCGC14_2042550, partial [marine sediment metagenome]